MLEEYDDNDFPFEEDESEPWDEQDDDTPTRDCPHCGGEIYDDAVQCPLCHTYITEAGSSVWQGRGVLWLVLGLLGIAATVYVLVMGRL